MVLAVIVAVLYVICALLCMHWVYREAGGWRGAEPISLILIGVLWPLVLAFVFLLRLTMPAWTDEC